VSQGAVSKRTEINKVQVRTAAGRETLDDFIAEALSQEGSVARWTLYRIQDEGAHEDEDEDEEEEEEEERGSWLAVESA
jgi:hypothetical protein